MSVRTKDEIVAMKEGGRKLAVVRDTLKENIAPGVNALEIEKLANDLIAKSGGQASFKKVPGYSWATCVNVNEVVVHGIPKKTIVFEEGDVVSVDVGLYYKGLHTDTSFTVYLGDDEKVNKFLGIGDKALKRAIAAARAGGVIADISKEMEKVEDAGYKVMKSLVGHGVGKELHEAPQIPCYVNKEAENTEILVNSTYAIEIMYTMGEPELELSDDGWTISVRDGKITALYEETILVDENGPLVLTKQVEG